MSLVFYGGLISPSSLTSFLALPHALLSVSRSTGLIEWLEEDVPANELQQVLAKHGHSTLGDYNNGIDIIELKLGEFIMPGFIDTHTHAPQFPNIGSGQQHELLDWLAQVTFPMEARFQDVDFARKAYDTVVRRIINSGTTTCCYYGTLHLEATKVLADIVNSFGQRAFVGKCNMNRNSPDYYVEPSTKVSVETTIELISYVRSIAGNTGSGEAHPPLLQPILTPRFAISCTPELLKSLGQLAKSDPGLAIQTHISENEAEVVLTKKLFPPEVLPPLPDGSKRPKETTYAGVYDAFGLLRENTVLAHAVHLEDEEVELIKERKAGISHCPTSNFNLRSGFAKVGMLLDHGIKVGLGTDVSGGFSPSILNAVQNASICSKVVALNASPSPPTNNYHHHPHHHTHHGDHTNCVIEKPRFADRQLPVSTLLYLATQGGAEVCNLSSHIGSLTPGKSFDALLVSVRSEAGNPGIWGADLDVDLGVRTSGVGMAGNESGSGKTVKEELEGILERFLFCGDDRNIKRVYVKGRMIGGKEFRG